MDINTHTSQTLKDIKSTKIESTDIFKANYTMIDSNIDKIVKETLAKLDK